MAKSPKTDVLAQPVGVEATLTDKGVKVGIRSRFLAAWDRLGGSKADAKAADHEGEAEIKRARHAAHADLISVAGKVAAKEIEANPSLALAVLNGDFAEASRQYQNRQAVIEMAAEEILQIAPTEPETPTEKESASELDPDWMNHFYQQSSLATSDELRRAFARILAGEVVNPGTFAKRTLRALCELDLDTASHFNRMAKYRDHLNRHIARIEGDQVPYSVIAALDDAGLLANVPGVGFDLKPNEDKSSLLPNGSRGLLIHFKEKIHKFMPDTRVDVYTLTRFGKDICSILPTESNDVYLDTVADQLRSDKNISKILKVDVLHIDQQTGAIRYDNAVTVYEVDEASADSAQKQHQPIARQ